MQGCTYVIYLYDSPVTCVYDFFSMWTMFRWLLPYNTDTHVNVFEWTCVILHFRSVHICIWTCICLCTCIRIYIWICISICPCIFICICCLCICMHIHAYVDVCSNVHMYLNVCVYVYACTCTRRLECTFGTESNLKEFIMKKSSFYQY